MEKNKVSVYVAGQKFTLVTEDSEKQVNEIASRVDTGINSIMTQTNMSRERSAVLCALDFCDDELKARQALSEIKEQIKDYITDTANLRAEIEELKAKVDSLTRENAELKTSKAQVESTTPSVVDNKEISASDDLSFDDIAVPVTKTEAPQQHKADKKRHTHDHTNPYRQQYMQNNKREEKGYIPQRQYSLFDNE